ncbi:hypothetical protein [Nannocystis punicea]|uniref:Membrane protein 6-pyruvoyl-tetrahydropterin synthase-related domain-containing protein n=1 Tax=Nannocystis punicea TaxID=2995304 RepID=A0ABY7H3B7_9BACT|nr:hypothetical protein [Nannocystis poenicansa]WAS93489.1 hypothetical protein O0S08_45725 [Nannocystis poenicansa]
MTAARPRGRLLRLVVRTWPFILVTALGLWLLWPVPAGVMPLSADHTVHLTRAWLYGQQLAGGHLVGWSPFWFFGFPLGELYPPLGDLLVIAVRVVTLGLLDWAQAYALAFTLVFLLQGWALLRCGRALGLGPLAGVIAAALALLDAGAYREGGWVYTVTYGVWPQALATSLAYWALAELALAARVREGMSPGTHHRHLALAALAAAGALLAHPMSLPMLALAAPLWLITVGLRGAGSPAPGFEVADAPPLVPAGPPTGAKALATDATAPVPSDTSASVGAGRHVPPGTAAPSSPAAHTPPVPSDTSVAPAPPASDSLIAGTGISATLAPPASEGLIPGANRPVPSGTSSPASVATGANQPVPSGTSSPASVATGANQPVPSGTSSPASVATGAPPPVPPDTSSAAPSGLVAEKPPVPPDTPSPVPPPGPAAPEQPVPEDIPLPSPLTRRERLAGAALDLGLVLGLALALAAWWLWPMSAHRGYMASYGWLYAPLEAMLRMLRAGQWTQLMAPAAGFTALLGLGVAAVRGSGFLRFVALLALVHWLLASTDVFWTVRLDRLSSGFSHIQYQRFLTAAKPGLFLLAGALAGGLAVMARRTWSKRRVERAMSIGTAAIAAALIAWLARDAWNLARRHGVGVVQTERMPGDPAFAAAYEQFLQWAASARQGQAADWRIAVRTDRNAHWFMDSPVYTGTPIYKIGFTPGDNFVHKPESGSPRLLDLAQARYLLTQGGSGPAQVASFGPLRVFERPGAAGIARIDGPGELLVDAADLQAGLVRVRLAGTAPDSRLVFHVAGYPRWDLSFRPGDSAAAEAVPWIEVPVVGDGPTATPEQRLRGELRGGKALGDDGSEPTLIAAPARDGVFELRYARWRWFDAAGLLATLAALAACVSLVRSPRLVDRLRPLARNLARPAVLIAATAAVLLLAGLRWQSAAARERPLASARVADGRAAATHARSGPLKTDMLIFPAVLADPRRPTEVVFSGVAPGPMLDAWFALDDDDAKQRRRGSYRVQVDARPPGSATWTPLADFTAAHRPDRQRPRIPVPEDMQHAADLAVRITPSGEAPPKFGFDVVLPDP